MRTPIKILWRESPTTFRAMVISYFLYVGVFLFFFIYGLVLIVRQQYVGIVFVLLCGREGWWASELARSIDRARGIEKKIIF